MILVTGGTGLVGSHLLFELVSKGNKVRALKRPGSRAFDLQMLFNCFQATDSSLINQVEWVEGDILDPFSLQKAMEGVEFVYHCAAYISFNRKDLKKMLAVNIEGTANLVNACLENKISKLCHVSSIASLGHIEKVEMIDEKANWKTSRYNSGYAISKYGGEREVWRGIEEGLKAVIVNPSVIIGAGCHRRAVNRLLYGISNFLPFYTSGVNGYVDVHDVVDAMILLMESNISGERYIINAENITLRELFTMAADILGKRRPFIAMNGKLLSIAAWLDVVRCVITGSRPLITRENVRAATAISNYDSTKFISAFDYSFKAIRESLHETFRIIEHLKNRTF